MRARTPVPGGPSHDPWATKDGRRAIACYLRRELARGPLGSALGAFNWELVVLETARRALTRAGRRRLGDEAIERHARGLARELSALRESRLGTSLDARVRSRLFRGRRADLQRLLECTLSPLGSADWRRWRRGRPAPDLRGADLHDLLLTGYDLSGADLRGANLAGAVARDADFRGADLCGAFLRHADLSYAQFPRARLAGALLVETALTRADLRHADLRGAFLLGATLNRARISRARFGGAIVWGVTAWNCEPGAGSFDDGLRVAVDFDPDDGDPQALLRPGATVEVDGLKVAHFVSLLFQHPLGGVIDAAADRIVLLLGRFTEEGEAQVLEALRTALPGHGYAPIVFDFRQPKDRDVIETVAVLAGLSSFVIANLSRPRSTPLETQLILPTIAVPFVPIVRADEDPFAMFGALQRKYPWVLPTVRYRTAAGLVRRLERDVIGPARRCAGRMRRLKRGLG